MEDNDPEQIRRAYAGACGTWGHQRMLLLEAMRDTGRMIDLKSMERARARPASRQESFSCYKLMYAILRTLRIKIIYRKIKIKIYRRDLSKRRVH